jgi:mono/diheme cytochrome c family protein
VARLLLACAALSLAACFVPQQTAGASKRADRAAGAKLFEEKGCAHCHGADGVGTDDGPSLATVGKRMHRDQIAHQIRFGGKQMPAFGDSVNDDELRNLVEYLAHKKKAPKKKSAPAAS